MGAALRGISAVNSLVFFKGSCGGEAPAVVVVVLTALVGYCPPSETVG